MPTSTDFPPKTHALANGQPAAARYGSFGISHQRMVPPPERTFSLIVGEPNAGKTSLPASYEGALIVNLDCSSTPSPSPDAPAPAAQFWPAINAEGQTVGPDGQPFALDWEHVERVRDALVEAAVKGAPRPKLVVLDSVGAAIALLRDHLAKKAGKASFTELRGDAAWENLYDRLIKFAETLKPHYGVWFIAHITRKLVKAAGSEDYETVFGLATPPGFMPRFFWRFEMSLVVESRLVMEKRKVQKTLKVQGKTSTYEEDVVEAVKRVFVTGEHPNLPGLTKRRVALPSQIELPPVGAWAAFSKAYQEAATPANPTS